MGEYSFYRNKALQETVLKDWLSGEYLSSNKLAIHHGLSHSAVYCFLKKKQCVFIKTGFINRKYALNESYFDVIDTEEKAYFLGWLYSDGYNNEKDGVACLILQERDKNILLRLNECIGSEKSLTFIKKYNPNRQNYYKLIMSSRRISTQLASLGCMQAKTFKIVFPEWLNVNLRRHFVRGYFDGDGCISGINWSLFGRKVFLEFIQNLLIKELNLSKTKILERETLYVLKYNGYNNLTLLYNWFYSGATIWLGRKKDKFDNVLTDRANRTRKWSKIKDYTPIENSPMRLQAKYD
jgi:hypothetical protein